MTEATAISDGRLRSHISVGPNAWSAGDSLTNAEVFSALSELLALREAVNGDSPRTDDIAAASVLYQCADCVRAEADYSCHRREDVFVIGREVICRDCADAGHAGEQRRAVPDIPAKLKRQRMAISALSKGSAHV